MPKSTLIEMGNQIKRVYTDRLGGDPEELIRIWDEGEFMFVLKNDDTQAVIAVGDLIHGREENIARALETFQPVD